MAYKLFRFDVDGVIFEPTNFWMRVHEVFGVAEVVVQGNDLRHLVAALPE